MLIKKRFALRRKNMKKLLCLILAVAAMLCVVSCGEEPVYEPGTKFYNVTTRISTAAKETEQRHYYDVDGKLVLTEVFPYDIQKEKVTAKDPTETITYAYDEAGNLAKKTTTVASSGAVTELSYKYDEDGNVIEYIKTDAGKTEKYNYYFTAGRLVGETYETSITVSGETIPVTQNSTTTYTYDSDDTLNCKYDTVVILSYAGQQTVYNLTGHKSYDERGELFSHAGEVASNVTVKSVTSDGATFKAAVADITYESNKYRYLYQEDKDFDGDGKKDSVIVKINTYSEWDELLSTERYLYDDYGNVLSYKQFNPSDNSVIYAEVNTVSPDAPRK